MGNRRVQLVRRSSILEKRFARVRTGLKRVSLDGLVANPPAAIVAQDLRNGCLTSLNWYLKANAGIPDPEVALELRKLIAGTKDDTRYRIVGIEHPHGAPPKKGRPKKSSCIPTARQFTLAHALIERAKVEPKVEIAANAVAVQAGVSIATVYRAASAVDDYEVRMAAAEANRARIRSRFNQALTQLSREKT